MKEGLEGSATGARFFCVCGKLLLASSSTASPTTYSIYVYVQCSSCTLTVASCSALIVILLCFVAIDAFL